MTAAERTDRARAELMAARKELQQALAQDRTRARAPLNRHLHEVERMLWPDSPYRSQAGQDRVIDRLFQGKTGGVFADIGGYDGTSGSNTLFFEQMRGWTGLLAEPVPAQLAKARRARKCLCLDCAVAAEAGTASFIVVAEGYTQMSGLAQTYEPGLLAQVRQDPRHKEEQLTVQTRTLSDLLTETGFPHPDFVSLDIEGGEIAVLESFPFDRHDISAWSIENNTASPRIPQIMRDRGYDLVEFCGPDDIYFKSRS